MIETNITSMENSWEFHEERIDASLVLVHKRKTKEYTDIYHK